LLDDLFVIHLGRHEDHYIDKCRRMSTGSGAEGLVRAWSGLVPGFMDVLDCTLTDALGRCARLGKARSAPTNEFVGATRAGCACDKGYDAR
jgi:hypothetical protein